MGPLWRRRLEPLVRPLIRFHARRTRGMTLGVRGLVIDDDGRVLLIEHTYVRGWHLPGGGVERGETAEQAIARELVEEAGVELTTAPTLVAVDTDHALYPGDHVLLFRAMAWRPVPATSRGEIHAVGWHPADALPPGTTRSTVRHLRSALGERVRVTGLLKGDAKPPSSS